ncbi:MAG: beta-lactamase family protein [Acidobacteria bacterium]|nr:beta-lactamase family protein [Acidobacteriota bacterium]
MTRRTLLCGAFAAIQRGQIDAAMAKIQSATASGDVSAAALYVEQGSTRIAKGFGKARSENEVFLLASITKPMTAAGVMKLVERGHVKLDDPVKKYIPEFSGGDRDRITVKMLLTHTSGLPDMLADNEALRKKHASLKDFVAGTCKTPLLFQPGTQCKYQSMGILLASEIAERVTRTPFRDFLRKEIFTPLGMTQTSLGLGGRKIADLAQCQVPNPNDDWNWNTPYWRDLGAPWGGAHASAADVARFLKYFLQPSGKPLSVAIAHDMIANQNQGLNKPWGIGFMIDPGTFGKSCSAKTYGHYGSTGTVCWADPTKNLICVLLTTKPADQSRAGLLGPVSDMVASGG